MYLAVITPQLCFWRKEESVIPLLKIVESGVSRVTLKPSAGELGLKRTLSSGAEESAGQPLC